MITYNDIEGKNLFYKGEDMFKEGYYEDGAIAVYTIYVQAFASYYVFGHKLDI